MLSRFFSPPLSPSLFIEHCSPSQSREFEIARIKGSLFRSRREFLECNKFRRPLDEMANPLAGLLNTPRRHLSSYPSSSPCRSELKPIVKFWRFAISADADVQICAHVSILHRTRCRFCSPRDELYSLCKNRVIIRDDTTTVYCFPRRPRSRPLSADDPRSFFFSPSYFATFFKFAGLITRHTRVTLCGALSSRSIADAPCTSRAIPRN